MIFREKLIQRRKALGMTQEDLATRLDVSRQTVSKWEIGECMPDVDNFIRLSEILEVSLDELGGREVEIQPIVLPAPEIPQSGTTRRKPLKTVLLCLLVLVIGLAIGKYALQPANNNAEQQTALLPDELTVSSFDFFDGVAIFTTNTVGNGTVYLYYNEDPGKTPLILPAVYKNGYYTVSDIPYGEYSRMEFYVVSEGQELNAKLAENIKYGIGYDEVSYDDVSPTYDLDDDFEVDKDTLERAIRMALLDKAKELRNNLENEWVYAEAHKTWGYEIKDNIIYAYVTARTGLYYPDENGKYVEQAGASGPCVMILPIDTYGYYSVTHIMEPKAGSDLSEFINKMFPSDMADGVASVDYDSDFYQDQLLDCIPKELTKAETDELEARIAEQYLEELKKASDERVSNGEEGAELLDYRVESVRVLSNEEKQSFVNDGGYCHNDILAVVNYSIKPKDIGYYMSGNGEVDGEWMVNKQACVCIREGEDRIEGLGGTGF